MWYATKIAEMNELDPYLFKKIKIFEIGRAENFLEPEQVERIPKNRKFWNYRLLKKFKKKHEFLGSAIFGCNFGPT